MNPTHRTTTTTTPPNCSCWTGVVWLLWCTDPNNSSRRTSSGQTKTQSPEPKFCGPIPDTDYTRKYIPVSVTEGLLSDSCTHESLFVFGFTNAHAINKKIILYLLDTYIIAKIAMLQFRQHGFTAPDCPDTPPIHE